MNITNGWFTGSYNFPTRTLRWAPALAIALTVLLSLWAPGTLAQETKSDAEIRESLRQEILRELKETDALEALKEEIKREILQDLREDLKTSERANDAARQKLEEDIREKLLLELDRGAPEVHPQAAKLAVNTAVGNAEGRMLRRGAGLAGCNIKLVKFRGTNMSYQRLEESEEYVTTTNREGNYRFAGIPVGDYKIKWELPGDSGWIKRIRDVPDVEVVSGRTSTLKPIETARQLAPR